MRIKKNSKRVNYRQSLKDLKEAKMNEAAKQRQMSEEKRIEKLNKLITNVPYYQAIQNAKPLFRIKSTSARENDIYRADNSSQLVHGKITSFTEERFNSNQLFKLGVPKDPH